MPEETSLVVIITQKGFRTYRDLLIWTKENLNPRDIRGNKNAVLYREIIALYTFHFGISREKAETLARAVLQLGFTRNIADGWAWAETTIVQFLI